MKNILTLQKNGSNQRRNRFFSKVVTKCQYDVCYNDIVEWCGTNNRTFLLLEWETSSHYITILGVRLIPQQIPQCVLLFGGVLTDATILGGGFIWLLGAVFTRLSESIISYGTE